MTSWTARIDALLAEKPDPEDYKYRSQEGFYEWDYQEWLDDRLDLAAERMRGPHSPLCIDDMQDDYMREDLPTCTCGLVADVLRILEGR